MIPFQDITHYTPAGIQSLIDNNVEESVYLDFKAAPALEKSDKKKDDISKDISAFANSDGGVIVYGISECNHCAGNLSFIDGNEITKEWLEQVITTRISERIDGIQVIPVRFDGELDKTVYVVKIPRSNRAPHMCSDHRYYKRHGSTSIPMEEYEVRDLFNRVNKSSLEIGDICVIRKLDEEVNGCKIEIYSSIINSSTVTETIYKLNYYLTAPGGISMDSISWDAVKDTMNYTRWTDGLKISAIGTAPLFPGELIDIGRFIIDASLVKAMSFIRNTSVRIVLFFQGGQVEKKFELNQFFDNLFPSR